jgi:hypothetical protein
MNVMSRPNSLRTLHIKDDVFFIGKQMTMTMRSES